MKPKIHIPFLPLAANICEQFLREVCRNDRWSMAHVTMNPGAASLLHEHKKMKEVYIITRGYGELFVGERIHEVCAGSVLRISTQEPHKLVNTGATSLEHLVLATPPFDPEDIVIPETEPEYTMKIGTNLPQAVECFDGAKIMPHDFPELDLSFAFGWVINDRARHKKPHYHEKITEFVYIVEGNGFIEVNGAAYLVGRGDWIEIPAGSAHMIYNFEDQHMVALCICSPRFDMADVHYKD